MTRHIDAEPKSSVWGQTTIDSAIIVDGQLHIGGPVASRERGISIK